MNSETSNNDRQLKIGRQRLAVLLSLIVIVLIGTGWSFWQPWHQRNLFAEDIIRGFPTEISLQGQYRKVTDEGWIKPPASLKAKRYSTDLLLERILSSKTPAESDIEAITGTNWIFGASNDGYYDQCFGADAWRRCVESLLGTDMPLSKRVEHLSNWPSALFYFSLARTYPKSFIRQVAVQLEDDGNIVRKALEGGGFKDDTQVLAAAAALYQAAGHLDLLSSAPTWRRYATRAMCLFFEKHQKSDGTIDGNVDKTIKTIETVMPAIAVAYRAGNKIDPELAGHVQPMMDFLMYYLDMYGCLPFVSEKYLSSNKRDWLYWAAKAFQRPDFAWVAYGGLDMLEAQPPARCSRAFDDANMYVMRNNWEIRRMNRRQPLLDSESEIKAGAKQSAYMSNTLHFDAGRGIFQIFAFGRPQVTASLPVHDFKPVWQDTNDLTICYSRDGQYQMAIIQLNRMNVWVLRIENLTQEENLRIQPVRTKLKRAQTGAGIVSYSERQPSLAIHFMSYLPLKSYGSLCIRTDGVIRDAESAGFEIKASSGKSGLTVVFLAANGVSFQNDRKKDIPSEEMAESRKVAFSADGCVFDDDIWESILKSTAGSKNDVNKVLLEMKDVGSIQLIPKI